MNDRGIIRESLYEASIVVKKIQEATEPGGCGMIGGICNLLILFWVERYAFLAHYKPKKLDLVLK